MTDQLFPTVEPEDDRYRDWSGFPTDADGNVICLGPRGSETPTKHGIQADVWYKCLIEFEKKYGDLEPSDKYDAIADEIVSNPQHPLHAAITVDQREAARRYWRQEVRVLYQTVRIVAVSRPVPEEISFQKVRYSNKSSQRAFYSTNEDGKRSYATFASVVSEKSSLNDQLDESIKSAEHYIWKAINLCCSSNGTLDPASRYNTEAELRAVLKGIQDFRARLEHIRDKSIPVLA